MTCFLATNKSLRGRVLIVKSVTYVVVGVAYDETIGFAETPDMAAPFEQMASSAASAGSRTTGDLALFVVAIVIIAGMLQFFMARSLRRHGRPAQQAENLATAAAATLVVVLVPMAAYLTRS